MTHPSYGDVVNAAWSYEAPDASGTPQHLAGNVLAEFVATARTAAYAPLVGLPLGRRELQATHLQDIADIVIVAVREHTNDLATADRVAYVLARRAGTPHVVIAYEQTYLVCQTNTTATNLTPYHHAPTVLTVAQPDGNLIPQF